MNKIKDIEEFKRGVTEFIVKMKSKDDLINKSMSAILDSLECNVEKHAKLLAESSGVEQEIVFNFLMINISMHMARCGSSFIDEAAKGLGQLIDKSSMH